MKNIYEPTYIHLKKKVWVPFVCPRTCQHYGSAWWKKKIGKMTTKNWVHILNIKSVCKQVRGVRTIVAKALNVGFPSCNVCACEDGCLIVGEENAVCFFSGLESWATEPKARRCTSQRIAPAETDLRCMVLHDACLCDHLPVCFQPGDMWSHEPTSGIFTTS